MEPDREKISLPLNIGIIVKGLPPWTMGGNPREALQIAAALYSGGMKATIICFSPSPQSFKEFKVVPMKPIPYLPRLADVMAVPQVFTTLVQAVRRLKIDLLLAFSADSSEGLATPLASKITRRPCIVRTTGGDILVSAQKYPFLVLPSLTLCHVVVPISEHMRNLILQYLPQIRAQKIQIIPIAVDTNFFSPRRDGSNVREMYGLEDAFTILTVTRLVKRKGVDYLLMSMRDILQEDSKAKLLVVGDGPEREALMALATYLNITKSVVFENYVSDHLLPEYYAACDVFVLPSIIDERGETEAFGKVLAEALACERPVVGTRVGGIPSIVRDGETGFLVEQRQPKALAEAIIKLKNDPEISRRMAKHGRTIVIEKYDCRKVMEQWINLFRGLSIQQESR